MKSFLIVATACLALGACNFGNKQPASDTYPAPTKDQPSVTQPSANESVTPPASNQQPSANESVTPSMTTQPEPTPPEPSNSSPAPTKTP